LLFQLIVISAILVLFLNLKLGYDKDTSTAVFHSYVFLAYLLPLAGSIIADSWWGAWKTLVWMALVFTAGAMMLAVGTIDVLHLPIT
jgi:solute carrier family 15 (oligopeptide transporter), member 1